MPREREHRAASAAPAASRHKLTSRNKPSYKVVLEQVTQQKKKLIVVGSSQPQPPPGYTFIPAGDPQITGRCKQFARADGAKVFEVSAKRKRFNGGIADQMHRIGYHFPSSIVARACTSLGIDLSRDGRVLHNQQDFEAAPRPKARNRKWQKLLAENASKPGLSQAAIDTQAREAIKDLFPKIPQKDLHDIVTHAFELGTQRVGAVEDPKLSLPRRVQLAVVAHIRHNYTQYDKLLKQVPWQAARAMIEQPSLDKLAQWRGDDNEEPDAMEEILREVIVIPDDDEEDSQRLTSNSSLRQGSVEMISSRALADDVETRPIDYAARRTSATGVESPDSDDDQEVTFLGHGQYVFDRPNEKRTNQDGTHRLRAWEEARSRLRQPKGTVAATDARPLTEIPGLSTTSVPGGDPRNTFPPAPQRARPADSHRPSYSHIEPQVVMSSAHERGARYEIEQDHNRTDHHGRVLHLLPSSNHFRPAEVSESKRLEPHHSADARPGDMIKRRHVLADNVNQNRVSTLYMSPNTPGSPHMQQSEMRSPSQAPMRFENIAQSIESPNRARPAEIYSDRVIYSMPSSHGYHPEDIAMQDRSTYRRVHQNFDEGPQATKRRRLEAVDTQFSIRRNGPNDQQETVLIPIGHTGSHDSVVRHIHEPNSAGRVPRLQEARPLQRIVYVDQRDAPVFQFRPTESDQSASYSIDSPRHRQFLLSPQKPPFHSFSATAPVEPLTKRLPPENPSQGSLQSVSYGASPPYVSLPREVPRASNVASGSERGAVQSSSLGRAPQPSFGETLHSKEHWLQREGSLHMRQEIRAKQPERYTLERPPAAVHADRPRRYLPLERDFEEQQPMVESTSANNFHEPKHPSSYTKGPMYVDSHEGILRTRPLHQQEEVRLAEPSRFVQHDITREPFRASGDNDNRWD
ncbi:hypothetical protein MMC30_000699 [Trapelia coarctata]|nr:hypothetical protein [Trapelia coarctata]